MGKAGKQRGSIPRGVSILYVIPDIELIPSIYESMITSTLVSQQTPTEATYKARSIARYRLLNESAQLAQSFPCGNIINALQFNDTKLV